jgi:hypothetical protein
MKKNVLSVIFILLMFYSCSSAGRGIEIMGKQKSLEGYINKENITKLESKFGSIYEIILSSSKSALGVTSDISFYENNILMRNPKDAEAHYKLWVLYNYFNNTKLPYNVDIDSKYIDELSKLHFAIAIDPNKKQFYFQLGKLYESISFATDDKAKNELYKSLADKNYDIAEKYSH